MTLYVQMPHYKDSLLCTSLKVYLRAERRARGVIVSRYARVDCCLTLTHLLRGAPTHRALAEGRREIAFLSEVADGHNFPMNLTGCRVLHFTWNGDCNQEQV